MTKFIIVTGGVLSGLGKGILTASIGNLISSGKKCATIKCDGYLNIDPGKMNPGEHGEVFVLDDGTECDMDFGHYERFVGVTAKGNWSFTMGKVFQSIFEKEKENKFFGKTIQFVPHVTDEIKERINNIVKEENAEIVFIEIGGTVGDLENALYLEAMRQLSWEQGKENVLFVHLSYVPIPVGVNEQKSKPTQMSVKLLNEIGIQPDIIVCRCCEYLTSSTKKKISLFCNLPEENVLTGIDVDSVYLLPRELRKQNLDKIIEDKLKIKFECNDCLVWDNLAKKMNNSKKEINIGICGDHTDLSDSYASIIETLKHCSANLNIGLNIKLISAKKIEDGENIDFVLDGIDGIIIPNGFDNQGWEGKVNIAKYARENNIPFLGICLGLQAAIIEYARNVCGLDANSTQINSNIKDKIVTLLNAQKEIVKKDGVLRLGAYKTNLKKNSVVFELYSACEISERHRHEYEVNPNYYDILEKNGLVISGLSSDKKLVDFIELPKEKHCYFVATQSLPELKSKLEKPSPLFFGLLKAIIKK